MFPKHHIVHIAKMAAKIHAQVKNISQNACLAGKMSKRLIANHTSNACPADQRFAQAEMSKWSKLMSHEKGLRHILA